LDVRCLNLFDSREQLLQLTLSHVRHGRTGGSWKDGVVLPHKARGVSGMYSVHCSTHASCRQTPITLTLSEAQQMHLGLFQVTSFMMH